MPTKVIEELRTRPSVRVPVPAQPTTKPARRRPSRALQAAPWIVAAAIAVAAFASFEPLPFDLAEEATVNATSTLPPAARAVARVLGTAPRAWRALGAVALGLMAVGSALLVRRCGRGSAAQVAAALVAGTHAVLLGLAADARGSLALLAAASALGAACLAGRSVVRIAATAVLAALAWMLLPDVGTLHLSGGLAAALNRAAESSPTALAGAGLLVAAMLGSLALRRPSRHVAVAGCAAALAFAAMGVGTAARELGATRPARLEAQRFLARLDALAPLTSGAEIVLDAPGGADTLAAARPGRSLARTPDAGTAGRVRVVRWAPPADEGPLSLQPPDLRVILDAEIDPRINLVEPAAQATLLARGPEDEPEFRFNPGPGFPAGATLEVVILATDGHTTHAITRDLDDAIVRRDGSADAPILTWKPAWRPMDCPERELRWEDGEVCPQGGSFWWTIAVVDGDYKRVAPFRRCSVLP